MMIHWNKSSVSIVVVAIAFVLSVSLTADGTEVVPSPKDISHSVIDPWSPATSSNPSIQDLFQEYNTIFRYGNRNAASHRWSTFLLDRAGQMTADRMKFFFSGFCAVSGSPVRPSDYNRYRLSLPQVGTSTGGGQQRRATGYLHYCCWPCVCDTQDFIRIDTKTITSSDGQSRRHHFAVIGNPCDHPEALEVPFVQPFGFRTTTLSETAQEVRCLEGGILEGATVSDHGYIIIGMFFEATPTTEEDMAVLDDPQPGRVTTSSCSSTSTSIGDENDDDDVDADSSVLFQDEREWDARCTDRAINGYNSGMGEIFRKVCAISPIPPEDAGAIMLPLSETDQTRGVLPFLTTVDQSSYYSFEEELPRSTD